MVLWRKSLGNTAYVNTAITTYKTMILPTRKKIYDLQLAQNRILRTCLYEDGRAHIDSLHQLCNIAMLNLFMYKQKQNVDIVNTRNARTRAHDALIFKTLQNEKYKRNIFYKGALSWNRLYSLPVHKRNIDTSDKFKDIQKKKL